MAVVKTPGKVAMMHYLPTPTNSYMWKGFRAMTPHSKIYSTNRFQQFALMNAATTPTMTPWIDTWPHTISDGDNELYFWSEDGASSGDGHTVHDFVTKKGYRISIKPDGDYEIVAPENLVLADYLRAHPNGKILAADGKILEFQDGKLVAIESLLGVTDRCIDIRYSTPRINETLLANSFGKIAVPMAGCRLLLPDGTELDVHHDGGYTLSEANKTFIYKAAPRGFNQYLNASDVLEGFIRYLGSLQVRQKHVMEMPLSLYVKWLIIQAAKADGDPWEDVEPPLIEGVKAVKAQPRCNFCKRFISQVRADRGVHFCSPGHMQQFLMREDLDRPRPSRRLQIAAPPSETYFPMAAE